MTIRRDLDALKDKESFRRTHGGAVLVHSRNWWTGILRASRTECFGQKTRRKRSCDPCSGFKYHRVGLRDNGVRTLQVSSWADEPHNRDYVGTHHGTLHRASESYGGCARR
jgi:hypothetical protein